MRVSSSAVTDDRTNASEICCRSTRTVAVARYRFGRASVKLLAPTRMEEKTMVAVHFRRPQMSSAVSNAEADCTRLLTRYNTPPLLWHHDDVGGVDAEVHLAA